MWSSVHVTLTQADEALIMFNVGCVALKAEIRVVKSCMGIPTKQKICTICSFCKELEDWLDVKLNLHQEIS